MLKNLWLSSNLPLLMEPEGLQQVQKNLPLVLSGATRIQSTGSHMKLGKKKNLMLLSHLRSSIQSSLFFPQFYFYKNPPCICLLHKRAICSTYLILLDTLMLTIRGKKLKLWEAFRNVLISPVASSICRRHWHHRHAYRILRQIVAKRLVNPHSKSWSIVLHSNLTTHFKV